MPGLWMNNAETPEGKYPIVLRRDGSVVTKPYFVIVETDPCFADAMISYAQAHEARGSDPEFVSDIMEWAASVRERQNTGEIAVGKPDEGPDPDVKDSTWLLAWARQAHKIPRW